MKNLVPTMPFILDPDQYYKRFKELAEDSTKLAPQNQELLARRFTSPSLMVFTIN
jgi:hypothetical protein